jgi:hypothetical protein
MTPHPHSTSRQQQRGNTATAGYSALARALSAIRTSAIRTKSTTGSNVAKWRHAPSGTSSSISVSSVVFVSGGRASWREHYRERGRPQRMALLEARAKASRSKSRRVSLSEARVILTSGFIGRHYPCLARMRATPCTSLPAIRNRVATRTWRAIRLNGAGRPNTSSAQFAIGSRGFSTPSWRVAPRLGGWSASAPQRSAGRLSTSQDREAV